IPFLRGIVVRRFRDALYAIHQANPTTTIHLVGHSFGTYLIGNALLHLSLRRQLRFGVVILSGSVLRPEFPWHRIIEFGYVRRIVNDCATRDMALVASQLCVLGTGAAGLFGFVGLEGDRFTNRYVTGGHSVFFEDQREGPSFMEAYWVPVLSDD